MCGRMKLLHVFAEVFKIGIWSQMPEVSTGIASSVDGEECSMCSSAGEATVFLAASETEISDPFIFARNFVFSPLVPIAN